MAGTETNPWVRANEAQLNRDTCNLLPEEEQPEYIALMFNLELAEMQLNEALADVYYKQKKLEALKKKQKEFFGRDHTRMAEVISLNGLKRKRA